jgi:hypothetical protein
MALDEFGEPTCACRNPLCDGDKAAGEIYWEWITNPNRREEDRPPEPPPCRDRSAQLIVCSQDLVDAFDRWCDEHAWSPTGLATELLEAFMFNEMPPSRRQLEDEHRLNS